MSSITRFRSALDLAGLQPGQPVVDMTTLELDDRISAFGKCTNRPDDAVFFPDRAITREDAQAACEGCPVVAECLERALRVEATPFVQPHGIYGAKTPDERKNLLRGRRRGSRRILVRDEALAVAS